jgi:glyoxylase-like metal-dependent hydrolase (beta-lactamase superfamily II)
MNVFGNLHWLNGRAANVYLFEDAENGWVMVDAGYRGTVDPVGYLAKLGYSADSLKHILVTHADVDHVGNLAKVQAQTGAQVYAGAKSVELISQAKFPSHNKWIIDRMSLLMRVQPTDAHLIQTVSDGDILPLLGGLHVIASPGHTADHHAFFSPSTGILFCGDAIIGWGGKIAPSKPFISFDYRQAQQSALKLAELNPALFACGHGKPYQHTDDELMALVLSLREI